MIETDRHGNELYPDDINVKAGVYLSCGRLWLKVNGFFVAMQGDLCRDPDLGGNVWTEEMLIKVATKIEKVVE